MNDTLTFTNPKVQRLRRLLGRRSSRSEERAFVVEGAVLAGEAIAAGWPIDGQYVAPGVVPSEGVAAVHHLGAGVAERVAATESPPGVFTIVRIPNVDATVLERAAFVVVADGVGDPGNLGTILRSAEAAGVDAVVLTPGTVDPFNPKVVRASAGAIFHVPVVTADVGDVRSAGLRLVGTSSHRGTAHTDADWSGRLAIVAGSEVHGVGAEVDDWVRIAHRGRAESLNVAMATTVLCFEAARARG